MPPLVPWDAPIDEKGPAELVWRGKLDNRYLVEVRSTSCVACRRITYSTTLFIFDHWEGDKELGSWKTGFPCHSLYESPNPSGWMREAEAYVDLPR